MISLLTVKVSGWALKATVNNKITRLGWLGGGRRSEVGRTRLGRYSGMLPCCPRCDGACMIASMMA